MKIIIILKEDIKHFPPVLTVINALVDLKHEVRVIGDYSDDTQKQELLNAGVKFYSTGIYDVNVSQLQKLKSTFTFRKRVNRIIREMRLENEENYYLWIFQSHNIALLYKLIGKYPSILHPLEFTGNIIKPGYRLLSPFYNVGKTYRMAAKVVNCEYNRSQITKGLYNLSRLPFVMPNKMYMADDKLQNPPTEILAKVEELKSRLKDKRVILYQGIFCQDERRLNEFCEAIKVLGPDYVFLILTPRLPQRETLEKEYASSPQFIFLDFIQPPYHLLITQLAHIGILTYFPDSKNISRVINPLYCAPNKIFEYGKFGIPMLGNNIPGLYYIFQQYKCGITFDYPPSVEKIAEDIRYIFDNYPEYSKGSRDYYESVDIKKIISSILEER